MKNSLVTTPTGEIGMVMESKDTFAKVLHENGSEGVFDKTFLTPVKAHSPGLPVARLGNDKLTNVLSKIKEANVGHDDFYGDVVIPFGRVREIIMHELKLATIAKQA